jgi:hypothetical protein
MLRVVSRAVLACVPVLVLSVSVDAATPPALSAVFTAQTGTISPPAPLLGGEGTVTMAADCQAVDPSEAYTGACFMGIELVWTQSICGTASAWGNGGLEASTPGGPVYDLTLTMTMVNWIAIVSGQVTDRATQLTTPMSSVWYVIPHTAPGYCFDSLTVAGALAPS